MAFPQHNPVKKRKKRGISCLVRVLGLVQHTTYENGPSIIVTIVLIDDSFSLVQVS